LVERSERCARAARSRPSIGSLLLLDTTFLIDVERGNKQLDDVIDDDDDVAIAAITVAELTVGVRLDAAPRRTRPHHRCTGFGGWPHRRERRPQCL
jgi:hypothetical protein